VVRADEVDEGGSLISWSGLAKRASREAAWEETGVRARFLRGRLERGSAEVGTDSGMGSDMIACLPLDSLNCLIPLGKCRFVA
jgi:hypothetical protein